MDPDRDSARAGLRRVREFIVEAAASGALSPGAQLPTERELAERFAVPRHALRRMLARLEAEGAITRHVGRGTFLAGSNSTSEVELPSRSVMHTSPAELMEARLRIEPALAELIVTNATPADFARMETCSRKRKARRRSMNSNGGMQRCVTRSPRPPTIASYFSVLNMVAEIREQAEWGKLKDRIVTPERRLHYQREHRNIVDALKARDAERARQCILSHLQHARRNLFGF